MKSLDPIDELTASLMKQSLEDTSGILSYLPPPAKRFTEELEKTGFTIFKPLSDLGFYEWEPDLKDISPSREITAEEIKQQLHVRGKPQRILNTRTLKLPFKFPILPPQIYENKYPLKRCEVAGIHVATKVRGLNLKDIDFVLFGGSTLSMLANKNESKNGSKKVYRATKIPGSSVGIVAKDENYSFNLADPSFQFERFVTGRELQAREDPTFIDHMHVMQVGKHRVLFIANVDAMNHGESVEVTFSNPFYWGIHVCLQCVSTGSFVLCHGRKFRGDDLSCKGRLDSISIKNLSWLYEKQSGKLKEAEVEIVRALDELKQELDDSDHSGEFEIAFSFDGQLKLQPQPGSSKLLPSPEIVEALLVV